MRTFFLFMFLVLFVGCTADTRSTRISVFVAASLTDVADSLSNVFEANNLDVEIRQNVGASSTLARQILSGAKADVFLSADTVWAGHVKRRSDSSIKAVLPARNSLVIYSQRRTYETPAALLTAGRISIADPSHVPAGQYARSALQCLGLWSRVEKNLIPTVDVRAALAAAATESVDASIVYVTDVAAIGTFAPGSPRFVAELPSHCQPKIRFGLVHLPANSNQSRLVENFVEFLLSNDNEGIWSAFGFEPLNSDIEE